MFNPDRLDKLENLKKEWQNIPENYVSVYHFTKSEALKGISERGIQHYSDIIPEEELNYYQKVKIDIDRMFDQVAIALGIHHKRSGSIFASPEFVNDEQKMGKGGIPLEIKVDPTKVIVSDGKLVTAASNSWLRTPNGKKWLENNPNFIKEKDDKEQFEKLQKEFSSDYLEYIHQYWEKAITLDEWNKLSTVERSKLFELPEIIVEGGVAPEFIRVKGDLI